MPFESPFTGSRIASIFSGGNPFQNRTPPFVPEQRPPVSQFPRTGNKRFMTSTIPTPNPVQSDVEEDKSGIAGQSYFDILQRISQNRPKQTAYEEALRNAPNRQDYAPSIGRRIAAALGGAASGLQGGAEAGVGAAEHILTAPYRGALQDYEQRTAAARAEAESEMAANTEYRENLKTGATLGLTEDKQGAENFYKGVEASLNRERAGTDRFKAETDRVQASNQIARWMAQSTNEAERNDLDRLRIGIDRGDKASLAEYRNRMAGAAEKTAGAAETRAEKYTGGGQTRMPQVDEQQVARDLVLEEMSSDPRYSNFIKPNQDKYGPAYVIKQADPNLLAEIQRRVTQKIQSSYPKYGSDVDWNSFDNSGSSPFEIGPLQR